MTNIFQPRCWKWRVLIPNYLLTVILPVLTVRLFWFIIVLADRKRKNSRGIPPHRVCFKIRRDDIADSERLDEYNNNKSISVIINICFREGQVVSIEQFSNCTWTYCSINHWRSRILVVRSRRIKTRSNLLSCPIAVAVDKGSMRSVPTLMRFWPNEDILLHAWICFGISSTHSTAHTEGWPQFYVHMAHRGDWQCG